MTEEQQRQYDEAISIRRDLDELFVRWADRDANGLVVCTVMLLQFVSMAGHLFDDPKDYDRFIDETVARGRARFNIENNGAPYVH